MTEYVLSSGAALLPHPSKVSHNYCSVCSVLVAYMHTDKLSIDLDWDFIFTSSPSKL